MSTTRFFLVEALTGENRRIQSVALVTRYAERSDHGAAFIREAQDSGRRQLLRESQRLGVAPLGLQKPRPIVAV